MSWWYPISAGMGRFRKPWLAPCRATQRLSNHVNLCPLHHFGSISSHFTKGTILYFWNLEFFGQLHTDPISADVPWHAPYRTTQGLSNHVNFLLIAPLWANQHLFPWRPYFAFWELVIFWSTLHWPYLSWNGVTGIEMSISVTIILLYAWTRHETRRCSWVCIFSILLSRRKQKT